MTVCPVALAVGCARCPAVRICPLKSVVGDYRPSAPATAQQESPAPGSKVQRPRKPAAGKKKPAANAAAGKSGRSGRRKQP